MGKPSAKERETALQTEGAGLSVCGWTPKNDIIFRIFFLSNYTRFLDETFYILSIYAYAIISHFYIGMENNWVVFIEGGGV